MSDMAWILVCLLAVWLASAYVILITVEPHEHISPAWIDIAFVLGPLFLIFGLLVAAQIETKRFAKSARRRFVKWRSGKQVKGQAPL